jgi:hypothetical protein
MSITEYINLVVSQYQASNHATKVAIEFDIGVEPRLKQSQKDSLYREDTLEVSPSSTNRIKFYVRTYDISR